MCTVCKLEGHLLEWIQACIPVSCLFICAATMLSHFLNLIVDVYCISVCILIFLYTQDKKGYSIFRQHHAESGYPNLNPRERL